MNRLLPIVATLLAGAALLVVLVRGGSVGKTSSDARSGAEAALATRFETLVREHEALQRSHDELAAKLSAMETGESVGADASENPVSVTQRLKTVEKRQMELDQAARDRDKYGVVATMEKELVTAYNTLLDSSQPVMTRARQVQELKRYGLFDDRARQTTTNLYHEAQDLNERGFILGALKGAVPFEFRDQIIADLDSDMAAGFQAPRFRYQAIEALEPMLPDPTVQQWLDHLAQSDPEPKLANRAEQALGITPPPGDRK